MTTDLNTVISQKRELEICADNLREARAKLVSHKEKLDSVWSAAEIKMIDDVIDRINSRLNRLASELNDIGADVLKTYQQIEEQERIAEQKRIAELKRKEEQKRIEEQRRQEEQKRLEEQKRAEEEKRLTEQKNFEKALSTLKRVMKF